MNIVIDIGHPGHVHLFRNFAKTMISKNNKVVFFVREKECELDLLKHYKLDFYNLGKHRKTKMGKIFGLLLFPFLMLIKLIRFKPDMFLSHGSIYLAIVSKLFFKPHISFEDTGNMEQIRLYKPFSDVILTSDVFPHNYGKKQIRYKGHHEIAYLHPNQFKVKKIEGDYAIIRLVSWNASHDIGQTGISDELLIEVIKILEENNIKVLISGESNLPKAFLKYKINIKPSEMLAYLANARVLLSEGATMAMEAAVLGTPAVYINTLRATNCEDVSQWGLCKIAQNNQEIIDYVKDVINNDKNSYIDKSKEFLNTKIDVTNFLVWFIENYPESVKIIKANPDYQYNFR
ncbi:MAG: DUF354 domain-containing protein, partial [Ignavibacteriales bacterium]|nr:DUF354 domain-containing protein [Ignavibacteriales bacterium]